jgi:hypothetical protein
VPDHYSFGGEQLVPWRAGESQHWQIGSLT